MGGPVAIDRKKWSSGPMVEAVEALKAMFLVENGSSGLGKRRNLSEIRPIEGSDPNVPILCPMESVWASETRQARLERVNGAMDYLNPPYFQHQE
jgi:hypothetical protein